MARETTGTEQKSTFCMTGKVSQESELQIVALLADLSYRQERHGLLCFFLAALKVLMILSIDKGGFVDSLFSSMSRTTRPESPSPAFKTLPLISLIKVYFIK